MSDADKTIVSSGTTATSAKRNPFLIIGGVGCLLLLCVTLLIGGSIYFFRDRVDGLMAQIEETLGTPPGQTLVTPAFATGTPTEKIEVTSTTTSATATSATPTKTSTTRSTTMAGGSPSPTSSPTPASADEAVTPTTEAALVFDEITFALDTTAEYDPIDPSDSFAEGVTEIHAIFDYRGMSPDYTWQRVWYLDDEEILNNSAPWSGDEAGRFDYFIDAGGSPLAPGEWLLELYVEGELLASGNFVIEPDATPEVAQVNTPAATTTRPVSPSPIIIPTPTPTPSGGGTFQLAFTKWDGGQHNLYVADTNGNNERFILGRAAGPSWTPNGQTIFFYGSEGVDRQEVEGLEYTFDGISNGVVALTASPLPKDMSQVELFQALGWKEGTGRTTTVSPNGQMVAFDARPGGGDYRIFFLSTSDSQQFQYQILGEQAGWSPDSEKIVYRSGRDGKTGLWISNRDDSGHTLITNGGSDSFPVWSPTDKTIAFSRDEGGNVDIYTMNPDGSNVQRLTEAPGPDTLPVYTPTGDIIFRSARSGRWAIWKMNASGGNQTEIISDAGVGPDWSFSRMSVR